MIELPKRDCAREACGESFKPWRRDQRFCSPTCRRAWHGYRISDVRAERNELLKEVARLREELES